MNERWRSGLRLSGGLLVTPVGVSLAIFLLRSAPTSPAVADGAAFAGAAGVALAGLAVAATAEVPLTTSVSVALSAALALGIAGFRATSSVGWLVTVDTALVCLAWGLGALLGRRVQHPSHLLPACVVAASADVISLLSPEGPSHAVAHSERALSLLAVWFPVPGTREMAPALGVGDLLFIAFVLGAARAHRLSYPRAIACALAGVTAAGVAAAWLGVAVPALVTIAAAVVLGLPGIRQLRVADRRAAHVSMSVAVSLALLTAARALFGY